MRSSVKKSVSPVPTLAQNAELNSVANKQQELENVANKQQVIAGSKDLEKKNDRVALTFLGIFVAALFFVIGAGFGNSQGNSLVDGAIDELVSNSTIEVDRGTLERAAIEGALKASGDGWANYFPSTTLETLNNLTANVLTGIGVSIREARSGAIEIAGIQENTPA
ncbi:MAG: hypothetical protein EBW41_04880, partial [Actinobacteria bacterium]|nr:hypothetical protein [Actinomycetota bacterium]